MADTTPIISTVGVEFEYLPPHMVSVTSTGVLFEYYTLNIYSSYGNIGITSENVTLTVHNDFSLIVNDAIQSQEAESFELPGYMEVASITTLHVSESLVLSASAPIFILETQDSLNQQISDNVNLAQYFGITVSNSTHTQLSLSPLLDYNGLQVPPEKSYDILCVNNLRDIHMIAGGLRIFTYYIYNEYGNLLELSQSNCSISIFKQSEPNVLIASIPGTIVGTGKFTATLTEDITESFSGVYQQQVKIVDSAGKTHIPSQGKIIVFPKANTS